LRAPASIRHGVWIGALFGPAQVGARLIEFSFGEFASLWVVRSRSVLLCAFVMMAVPAYRPGGAASRCYSAAPMGWSHHARRGAAGAVRRFRLRALDGPASAHSCWAGGSRLW